MSNRNYLEKFEQSKGARINNLIWIAGILDGGESQLEDFFYNLDKENWKEMLPDVAQNKYFDEYLENQDYVQLLIDFKKFGFLAEVNFPECANFRFDEKGEVVSWSVHGGICSVWYFYAETLEELTEKVQKKSVDFFNESISDFKQRKVA